MTCLWDAVAIQGRALPTRNEQEIIFILLATSQITITTGTAGPEII